jgi:hypothetical protein
MTGEQRVLRLDWGPTSKVQIGLLVVLSSLLLLQACSNTAPPGPSPPFAVTVATVLVVPKAPSWTSSGPCPVKLGLVVTVVGPNQQFQPGSYTYQWEQSDGTSDGPWSRTIDVGSGAPPFTDSYNYALTIAKGGSGWIRLHILQPNDIVSNQFTWEVTCTGG